MPDKPEGSPEIPDLVKKAQEAKPAGYSWTPGASKAAASVTLAPAPHEPTFSERLNSTTGRLGVLALVMLLVGGGLSLTLFQEGVTSGGSSMSAPQSTIKSKAFTGRDGMRLVAERDDSKKDRMALAPVKPGAVNPITGKADGGGVAPEPGADGGAPMNYDDGPTSRAAGASAGAAAGPGANGGAADGGSGAGGFVAPKLNTGAAGGVKFQGMRRVSGTAGFRGITGGRGIPAKTIRSKGAGANSADAAGVAGGSRGTYVGASGGGTAGPAGAGGAAPKSDSDSDSGGGGGAGGGGGGGGAGSEDPGLDADKITKQATDLMNKAAELRKDADKEEKNAKILAAQGQWPQAHYHYDKAEKKKGEADDKEKQAQQLLLDMKNKIPTGSNGGNP